VIREISVHEAIGRVLFHDITPGNDSGRLFKKGHIIVATDIPRLLDIGKDNLYVLDLSAGFVHENEAAVRIALAVAGPGLRLSEPSEGKVMLTAAVDGLLKINVEALGSINAIEEIALATLHSNRPVAEGVPVAGTRIIPLFTDEARLQRIEEIGKAHHPIVTIRPFSRMKVGLITTGNEVYHGRTQDQFSPVIQAKFKAFGSMILRQMLVSDSVSITKQAIETLIAEGAEMIVATGGMSVDPDDRTPASIRAAGAEVVTYGSPTFPGSMFMLAYLGKVPILGVPGCAMFNKATVLDMVLPRLLAGERLTRKDFIVLGHGGLCSACSDCRFPECSFGK